MDMTKKDKRKIIKWIEEKRIRIKWIGEKR